MKRLTTFVALVLLFSGAQADEKPVATSDTKVAVDSKAPDFTVTGADGKTFKLSDKLKEGKKNIVLLFSRAHW